MGKAYANAGSRELLRTLGLIPEKTAAEPEMGDAMNSTLTSTTGDEGRTMGRSNDDPSRQVATAFSENQRQLLRDPHNEAHTFPIGGMQSKAAAEPGLYERIHANSPVPIKEHEHSKHVGPFYKKKGRNPDVYGEDAFVSWSKDVPHGTNAALAHELGHHRAEESLLGRAVNSTPAALSYGFAPAAAHLIANYAPTKHRYPVALGTAALMSAPTLIREGLADYNGYQILKEHGATPDELHQYVKDLVAPQSSYLAAPALAALLAGAGRAINPHPALTKTAQRKLERRMKFRGLDISIETDAGSTREWHDPHSGESGSTTMKYPYGYIRKTLGSDGDHVDVYVGPNEDAENVYIVAQMKKPDFKAYDEDKCMLGFTSADDAKSAYLAHYNNPKFFGSMKTMTFEDFKDHVLDKSNHGEKIAGLTAAVKRASNMYEADFQRPMGSGPGPTHNQVPGDFLGLPLSQLGARKIVGGHPETPTDSIERVFRFHDEPMDTRVLEGNTAALPESPGV